MKYNPPHFAGHRARAHRSTHILAAAITVALWQASPLNAATRYVSTTGNNANAGTSTAPWRNLSYAAAHSVSGDLIHVKAGTYDESSVTDLPVGVSIEGEGDTTTTIRPATNFTSSSKMSSIVNLISSASTSGNQNIQHIGFDGRGHIANHAVSIRKRSNITIRDVTMKDCYNQALSMNGDYPAGYATSVDAWLNPPADSTYLNNILVEDCYLANSGLWPGGTTNWAYGTINFEGLLNSTIRNCTIDESSYGGFGIKGFLFKNSVISGCKITVEPNDPVRGKDFGIEVWYARQSEFFDNETNGGLSIGMNDGVGIHHNRIVMTNEGSTEAIEFGGAYSWANSNYIEGCMGIASWGDNRGLPQNGLRIQNNVFRDCQNAVIISAGDGAHYQDLRIENNTVDRSTELWGGGAIYIRTQTADGLISGSKVRNNLFTNTTGYGLSLTGLNGGGSYASGVQSTDVSTNMFWTNSKGSIQLATGLGSVTQNDTINANPLYKATGTVYPSPFYELQSTSPAKARGIDVGLPYLGSAPDLGAWIQPAGQRVEAEMNYSVSKDPGTNAVNVANYNLDSNKAVRLYDAGDAARIHFNIGATGNYKIGVRVRSGYNGNNDAYFPSGYSFKVDGLPVTFTGDTASISALDSAGGGIYWGTMNSGTMSLSKGLHNVEVISNGSWSVVDYMQTTSVP